MISRNLDIHCPGLNGGPVHQPFHFPSAPLPLPSLLSLGTGVPAAHGILDKPPASTPLDKPRKFRYTSPRC
jgi:hypothetical protein